jgi:NAD(P)-dependent dehydrogenase (short-subunit alcohol dehydrogenase family)
LDEIAAGFEAGLFQPLPRTTFPIESAVSAFRYLAQARNIGKVVLAISPPRATADDLEMDRPAVRPDATYLITGGTRGLGGRVAESLAALGARHLVLVGRDIDGAAARETARRVREAGAEPTLIAADAGDEDALAAVLATVRATLPPLRGVIHAAGVLADASLLNLDERRFRSVFPAKAGAALALDRATRTDALDFFISFSSIASVLGNAGQGNYAAANAVLDRLAWLQRDQGRAGQAINWGPWSEIGMSATARGQRVLDVGVRQIAPERGLAALGHLLRSETAESVVVAMDWARFMSVVPGAADDPFLSVMREEVPSSGTADRGDRDGALILLLAAPPEERFGLLEAFVRGELAKVLQLDPRDLPLDQPLNTVGLDSLMALELKNRVESALAISLPIVTLIQGPTISQLAQDLLGRIDVGDTEAGETAGAPESALGSAADMDALLRQAPQAPRV